MPVPAASLETVVPPAWVDLAETSAPQGCSREAAMITAAVLDITRSVREAYANTLPLRLSLVDVRLTPAERTLVSLATYAVVEVC